MAEKLAKRILIFIFTILFTFTIAAEPSTHEPDLSEDLRIECQFCHNAFIDTNFITDIETYHLPELYSYVQVWEKLIKKLDYSQILRAPPSKTA